MPVRPLLRRRTVVSGLAASVLVAGCDNGDEIAPPAATGSTSDTTATPPTDQATDPTTDPTTDQSPDEVLVEAAIDQLTAAFGVLVVARTFAPLRQPLAPLARAHRRHVEVLEGELGGWVAPELTGPAGALRAVRRSETQLQAALVDAATRAESGALAKLLASMSASVGQHLAVLPRQVGR